MATERYGLMPRARSYDGIPSASSPLQSTQESVDIRARLSPQSIREYARNKARRLFLGDESKSLRDRLNAELMQPVRVKLRDKICFTLGVVNMCLTVAIISKAPDFFWLWYTVWAIPLLIWRYYSYSSLKYQYFLLDYCYTVNVLCFIHLYLFPNSPTAFSLAFMSACGPLAWAILAWRNSLVFHDLEKVTSLFIHIMPPLLMFCQRWYYPAAMRGMPEVLPPYLQCLEAHHATPAGALLHTCHATYWHAMALPLVFYIVWQSIYYWITEVRGKHKFASDPELQTSLRWLARSGRGLLHDLALNGMRKLGLMGKEERFNPEAFKTKFVFMTAQFIYTVLTLLPTKLMYDYFYVNVFFAIFWGVNAAWNGSAFYIEVFSKRYIASIEEAIAKAAKRHERKLTAAVESIITSAAGREGISLASLDAATATPTASQTDFTDDSRSITSSVGATTPTGMALSMMSASPDSGMGYGGGGGGIGVDLDGVADTSGGSYFSGGVGLAPGGLQAQQMGFGFDFGSLADGVAIPSPLAVAVHKRELQKRRSSRLGSSITYPPTDDTTSTMNAASISQSSQAQAPAPAQGTIINSFPQPAGVTTTTTACLPGEASHHGDASGGAEGGSPPRPRTSPNPLLPTTTSSTGGSGGGNVAASPPGDDDVIIHEDTQEDTTTTSPSEMGPVGGGGVATAASLSGSPDDGSGLRQRVTRPHDA